MSHPTSIDDGGHNPTRASMAAAGSLKVFKGCIMFEYRGKLVTERPDDGRGGWQTGALRPVMMPYNGVGCGRRGSPGEAVRLICKGPKGSPVAVANGHGHVKAANHCSAVSTSSCASSHVCDRELQPPGGLSNSDPLSRIGLRRLWSASGVLIKCELML